MCANRLMKRKRGYMDLDLFKLILDRCEEEGIPEIKLYTVGESLLHPQFMEMWRLAVSGSFKWVYIFTNGALLDEHSIYELTKTDKCKIRYSFSGWDRKSYETIYINGSFEEAVRKMKILNKIVRERGMPAKALRVFGVASNDERKKKTIDFLQRNIGLEPCQINIKKPHTFGGYISMSDPLFIPGIHNTERNGPLYCDALNRKNGILYDGRVTACGCRDIDGELVIGDIRKQSIREIRRGEKFKKLVNQFKCGDLRGLICYRCSWVTRQKAEAHQNKFIATMKYVVGAR